MSLVALLVLIAIGPLYVALSWVAELTDVLAKLVSWPMAWAVHRLRLRLHRKQ